MSIKDIFEEKRKWKEFMARVKTLPEDYQIVYKEIQNYIFKVGPVDGISLLIGVVELFEEGAKSGKKVLEVTGEDVAVFCDELVKDSKTYAEIYMECNKSDFNKIVEDTVNKELNKAMKDMGGKNKGECN